MVTRRIFISMPADRWLTSTQNHLKWGLVERVENLGYTAEIFLDPTGRRSLSASRAWTADGVQEVLHHCHGAVLVGLPRWSFDSGSGPVLLPTEYSHYEGAIARTLALPLLVVAQADLLQRVVFDHSFGPYISSFTPGADRSWLDSPQFGVPFNYWREKLDHRRDVFLGCSGSSAKLAGNIRYFLEWEIGASVLDWQRDFRPGRSILAEIEEARVRCLSGVFLFTKDDPLAGQPVDTAAPRDNVVFEAGYFAAAKGKERTLIIRESGAKMPADLGGDIYASIEDRTDLQPVQAALRRFFATL
jgi:hypothetical protein